MVEALAACRASVTAIGRDRVNLAAAEMAGAALAAVKTLLKKLADHLGFYGTTPKPSPTSFPIAANASLIFSFEAADSTV